MIGRKLGKRAPHPGRRAHPLHRYLAAGALPTPPAAADWTAGIRDWGMLLNDQLGICAIAAPAHIERAVSTCVGRPVVPTDGQCLLAYEAIGGYDPRRAGPDGSNPTDGGCVMSDVLEYWRTRSLFGRLIFGYASIAPVQLSLLKLSTWWFGGAYLGLELPAAAGSLPEDAPWDTPGEPTGEWAPGTWGGHAVSVHGYDSWGMTVCTWGALKRMSWRFWLDYGSEAYAVLSGDFVSLKNGLSPSGLDITAMQRDLAALTARAG